MDKLPTKPSAGKTGWENQFMEEWFQRVTIKKNGGYVSLDSVHIGTWLIPFIRKLLASELAREREDIAKEIEGMRRDKEDRVCCHCFSNLVVTDTDYKTYCKWCEQSTYLIDKSLIVNSALTEAAEKVRRR